MEKDNIKINGSESVKSTDPDKLFEFESVEKILNYKFKNKSLLLQAFTDITYDEKCVSYDRLEFLGDTVLNMIITEDIYNSYPEASSGKLTTLRAANVNNEKLARVAVKHNLHRYLRHKKPLLAAEIVEFVNAIKEYPIHSHGLLKATKALADIVESTIGALYIDCNSTETVRKVIKPLLEPIIPLDTLENHPVTELYEMCQKKNLKLTPKDTWEEDKNFIFLIEDRVAGNGHHLTKKKTAKTCAAKDAVSNFSKIFGDL